MMKTTAREARPSSQVAADQNWPLKCICNLCQCGGHRCSTFSWNEQLQELRARTSGERDSLEHGLDADAAGEVDMRANLGRDGHAHCNYQQQASNERYLTGGVKSSKSPLEDTRRNQDDLLHVLVTRPEIASKPRDNIIFEGEMDLRTTFETSYEALARMRLDHWRRHQETQQQRQQVSVARNDDDGDVENSWPARNDRARTSPAGGGARVAQQADQHKRTVANHDDFDHYNQSASPISRKRTPSPQGQVNAAGLSSAQRQPTQQQQPYDNDATVAVASPAPNSPFIDPDLSPLIVYNANMNRLERVGVRRRNIHRPSTSLRPGAREYFGGQAEMTSDSITPSSQQQVTAEVKPHGAAGASTHELERAEHHSQSGRRHCLNHSGRRDNIRENEIFAQQRLDDGRHFEDKATLTDATTQLQLNDHMANAQRPLVGTLIGDQGEEQLLDAEQRQLADEEESAAVAEIQRVTRAAATLIDSQVASPDARGRYSDQQQQQQQSTPNGYEQRASSRTPTTVAAGRSSQQQQRQTMDSRQSRMQRVCQNQSFFLNENEYPEGAKGTLGDDYCIKIGGRQSATAATDGMQTPVNQLRVKKGQNLFRESPDFILTTGHGTATAAAAAANQQQQQQKSAHRRSVQSNRGSDSAQPRQQQSITASAAVADSDVAERSNQVNSSELLASNQNGSHDQLIHHQDNGCLFHDGISCQVLMLGHNFDFVGSKSGHKYFVEKQLESRDGFLLTD